MTADALEAVVARQLSCGVLGEITRSVLAFALEPADMLLGVEFEPDPLCARRRRKVTAKRKSAS
jgi:hypothetical protein